MRGKILSILLTAVFFSTLVANISFAPATSTMITIEPEAIYGHVGDYFTVDVTIDKVANLYAWEVKIQYPPYRSVLVPSLVEDGGFLSGGYFVKDDKPFEGILSVGCTLIGNVAGVSGSGVLCRITFFVMEAGEGPIDFIKTALVERVGTELYDINHQNRGAYYFGPTINLVRIEMLPGRSLTVGQTAQFDAKVKNEGDEPLYVKVLYEITRLEDSAYVPLGAGQWWYGFGTLPPPFWVSPLYVDGYYLAWERYAPPNNWVKVGTSPWLDAVDYPSNYIYCSGKNGPITAAYTFDDITIPNTQEIQDVTLEGYTNCDNIDIDLDSYTWAPTAFDWLGSLWGDAFWDWRSPRWVSPTETVFAIVSATLGHPMTNQELNDFELLLFHYTPTGGPIGTMMADAVRLNVQLRWKSLDPLSPVTYVVSPGGTMDLGSMTIGALHTEDVGTYAVTARAWYSYTGAWFNPSAKSTTLVYRVR